MDLLQRELERKKSVLVKAQSDGTNGKKRKYLKQSELRRLEEETEEKEVESVAVAEAETVVERERQAFIKRLKESGTTKDIQEPDATTAAAPTESINSKTEKKQKSKNNTKSRNESSTKALLPTGSDLRLSLSPSKVTAQLRAFGLPIRFFGEIQEQRVARLQVALQTQHQTLQGLSEMEEYRLGQGHGIRNPFLERSSRKDEKINEKVETKTKEAETLQNQEGGDEGENDPPKRIYKFLKGLLKEWEVDLEARPSSIANSVAGRNESTTLKQCKDYIRPLFKQLKRRKLEAGMQAHLTKIVEFAQQGEFVRAHDAYMDVAIGRAAWPIGVTMVGIHARSGRAKIESSNVAHVMNSELQRKYLTSVKRLLTYAQKKRPDVDPSKKVL